MRHDNTSACPRARDSDLLGAGGLPAEAKGCSAFPGACSKGTSVVLGRVWALFLFLLREL